MNINVDDLRGHVKKMYCSVARTPRADFHFPTGRPILEALGYPKTILDRIPERAVESFAGVGYHFDLDPLKEGEAVLDIGSGAGTDLFYAALQVGPKGRAVGLDMTDEMLEKARANRRGGDFPQVSFEKGFAEMAPFSDGAFDVVISNGVINLSPDKGKVFSEIRRVLRPSGRLMFSDIVTGVDLPAEVQADTELWAECIGGAMEEKAYLREIERAGLKIVRTRLNTPYAFTKDSTQRAAKKYQVRSLSVLAVKR